MDAGALPSIPTLVAEGRHRALLERARLAEGDHAADEAVAARVALAAIGLAPVYELVAAARTAHARGDAAAARVGAEAARMLARLGRAAAAHALVAELGLPAEVDAAVDALVDRAGDDRPTARVAAAADDDLPSLGIGPHQRAARLRWLAIVRDLEVAAQDVDPTRARALADEAAAVAPDGDDAGEHRLRAALWAWRSGDAPAAVALARRVAADLRAARPTPSGRMLSIWVEAVLAAIDRPDAACEWIEARGAPAPTTVPTGAHLIRRLVADRAEPVRATITPRAAAGVLAAGGQLWVELAGPGRLGEVRGIDATTGAVAIDDGGRRVTLWWPQLESASGPLGLAAVATVPAGATVESLAVDPRLVALDPCDVDDDGQAPPRGFVFHTARTVLAEHPTWARALWRWGQELEVARAGGHVEPADVLAWYGQAREHVAHAAWTFAAYARVLAAQDRRQEAAMAWRDALLRAPQDIEVAIACGTALFAAGRAASALAVLTPALAASAANPGGLAAAAEALLVVDAPGRARAAAELALDLDPTAIGAGHALVSCLERGDLPGRAREHLDRLRGANPAHPGLALRAAIAAARDGAWPDAQLAAAALVANARNPNTLALAVRLAWCGGDAVGAWRDVTAALREFGAQDALLHQASSLLAAMVARDAEDALAEITTGLSPPALASWAYALSEQRLHQLAITTVDRAVAAAPGLANARWHAARCRLRAGDRDPVRIQTELEAVVAAASGFALGRFALALVTVERDPAVALATVEPGLRDLAPLGWALEARALAALGRGDEAAAVELRLREAASSIGSSTLHAARAVGAPAVAAQLAAAAQASGVTSTGVIAEHAAALFATGDLDGAAATLAPLATRTEAGPDHLIASTALAAGAPAVAVAVAGRALRELRDSRRWDLDDAMDAWWYVAVCAAGGEPAEALDARSRLVAGAPDHPTAWALLARGRRGVPGTDLDRALVRAIAPGLLETIERGAP